MNYNDNNACLGVLEGSGFFHVMTPLPVCDKCGAIKLEQFHSNRCQDPYCEDGIFDFRKKYYTPTSDQAFEILVKMANKYFWFHFDITANGLVIGMPENITTFKEGPLSSQLIASIALLVINKPEELRGVVGGL